jgi:hypothetical protein
LSLIPKTYLNAVREDEDKDYQVRPYWRPASGQPDVELGLFCLVRVPLVRLLLIERGVFFLGHLERGCTELESTSTE